MIKLNTPFTKIQFLLSIFKISIPSFITTELDKKHEINFAKLSKSVFKTILKSSSAVQAIGIPKSVIYTKK